ncbi:peptidoglycan editing factor PgeF [Notoacmeibacter ruber]|nr:peptidoglycan editing factor PgeF [Notoacmeibacter ruber]
MLDALHGIRHGFFTRRGGVSDGIYASLNVGAGSDDDPAAVAENRRRAAEMLGSATSISTTFQVHSPDVVTLTEPLGDERPKCDALVTATSGLPIGILTADCGPVLFADGEAGVIGAAHAGWRGAFSGVLENTVHAMEALGANKQDIVAVLGPSISQTAYEVGPEFVERFVMASDSNHQWFRPSSKVGHAYFDLGGYIVHRLTTLGIKARSLGLCTYEDEKRFFSYRRTTHRKERDYGRQISVIMLAR